MNSKINLATYLRRIGFEGKPAVDIETLRVLQELHTQAIPFENLNPLLGLPILLDIKSLQKKLLADKRGGYCFEQNILFQHVLETIGFKVKGLAARVIQGGVEGHISPRTHMLLLVTVDKVLFVADVGFGGMTPTTPLLLEANEMQDTTLEPFRLDRDGDNYILQANVDDNWKSLYRFDLEEQFLPDYEVANWYTSANPASHFLSNLLVSRTAHDRR
ncbi:MAG: arylamine N-acetyltransferase, partial [Ginsengibacter sp.]